MRNVQFVAAAFCVVHASIASGVDVHILLRQNTPLDQSPPATWPSTIRRIVSVDAKGPSNVAAVVATGDGLRIRAIWRRTGLGEQTFWPHGPQSPLSPPVPSVFEDHIGISADGTVVLSAGNPDWGTEPRGFRDSIWMWPHDSAEAMCVVLQGMNAPEEFGEQATWRIASKPHSTHDSGIIWLGEFSDSIRGVRQALISGIGPAAYPLLCSDDFVDSATLSGRSPIERIAISHSGADAIAIATVASSGGNNQSGVIRVSGQPSPVSELLLLAGDSAGAQMPGHLYTEFGHIAVGDSVQCGASASWTATATTTGPAGFNHALIYNGQVVLQEGQSLDAEGLLGQQLSGPPLALDMSRAGDTVAVWSTRTGSGWPTPALFGRVAAAGENVQFEALIHKGMYLQSEGATYEVRHVFPIVSIGDSYGSSDVPVYAVVQLLDTNQSLSQALIQLAIPALPEHTCSSDYNQDGGGDTGDVMDLATDIASGTASFPPSSPDFNCDGSADTSDVIDLANVVAGSACP